MPGSLGEVRLGDGELGGRLDVRTTAAPQSRPACCWPESGAPSPSNDCPVRPCGQTQSALSARRKTPSRPFAGAAPGRVDAPARTAGRTPTTPSRHHVMTSFLQLQRRERGAEPRGAALTERVGPQVHLLGAKGTLHRASWPGPPGRPWRPGHATSPVHQPVASTPLTRCLIM